MDLQGKLAETLRIVSEQKQLLQEKRQEVRTNIQNLCVTELVLRDAQKAIADQREKIVELEEKTKSQQDRLEQAEKEAQYLKEGNNEAEGIFQAAQQHLQAEESAKSLKKENAAVETPVRSSSADEDEEDMEQMNTVASPEPVNMNLETDYDDDDDDDHDDDHDEDTEIRHEIDWKRSKQELQKGAPGAEPFYLCRCESFFAWKLSDMKRHIWMKTAPAIFACPEVGCEQKFRTTQKLKNHAWTVHKMHYEKSGCGRCGQLFDKYGDLRKHQIQEHPESKPGRKKIYDLTEDDSPASGHHDASAAASPQPGCSKQE